MIGQLVPVCPQVSTQAAAQIPCSEARPRLARDRDAASILCAASQVITISLPAVGRGENILSSVPAQKS